MTMLRKTITIPDAMEGWIKSQFGLQVARDYLT